MRSVFLSICLSFIFFFAQLTLEYIEPTFAHEEVDPPYAKWGLLAVKKTKAKYSDAQIIDYLHEGRYINDHHTTEKFKLWLKRDGHEFGVFVNITFNATTEEILQITFTETDR